MPNRGLLRGENRSPAVPGCAIIRGVDTSEIQAAFDDVFDQAILFHGFADYMRDYEIFIYATADPRTTMRYDRARKNLDRHPNYVLAAFMAAGT